MSTGRILIRPRRDLMTTALGAIVVAMIPTFGVMYWFGFERGSWGLVFAAHLTVVAGALVVLARQLTVHVELTETELVGNGIFSPLVRVPLERIADVVVVETHVGQSPETVTQLLVRDAEGRRLFRMRGNFWNPDELKQVIDSLPVAATVVRAPMSATEFFRAYPGSAYWFENRPVLRVLAYLGVFAFLTGVALWAVSVLGVNIPGL